MFRFRCPACKFNYYSKAKFINHAQETHGYTHADYAETSGSPFSENDHTDLGLGIALGASIMLDALNQAPGLPEEPEFSGGGGESGGGGSSGEV